MILTGEGREANGKRRMITPQTQAPNGWKSEKAKQKAVQSVHPWQKNDEVYRERNSIILLSKRTPRGSTPQISRILITCEFLPPPKIAKQNPTFYFWPYNKTNGHIRNQQAVQRRL